MAFWFSDIDIREAAKKILFLVAGPLRGGGGLNGYATKEKITPIGEGG